MANVVTEQERAQWRQEAHDLRLNANVWRARLLRALDALDAADETGERLALAYIEAANPGIDMAEVRALRALQKAGL